MLPAIQLSICHQVLEMLKHVGLDGLLLHGHDHQEAAHEESDAQLIMFCMLTCTGVNDFMRPGDLTYNVVSTV